MQPPEVHRLTCFGLDHSVTAWRLRPENVDDVVACIEMARRKQWSICPVGARNSFGDVFLLGEQASIDIGHLNGIVDFDPQAGIITVQAGTPDRDVIALVMPCGWQLPALSGSLTNTIAGDLSSNINGKDSWRVGTFGDQVLSFRIALADGSIRYVDRQTDANLFNAVISGLGLLGVVTDVTLRLHRVASLTLEERRQPLGDIHSLAQRFVSLQEAEADFAYAWVDGYATGNGAGRAVFEAASFVDGEPAMGADELRRHLSPPSTIAFLPPRVFWGVVSRGWKILQPFGLEAKVFQLLSTLKYRRAAHAGERRRRVLYPHYQYPMVRLFPDWNLKFAPEGFNEVQALFPAAQFEAAFHALMAYCRRHGRVPEVCATRRHRADSYFLSFAGDGLSLTLPYSLVGFAPGELDLYRRGLMEIILKFGGKVYLSKFPYMEKDVFQQMYPSHRRFLEVKRRVDPDRLFWSDAAQRLLS